MHSYLKITSQELSALMGLPYLQQVTYLLGIRPYMDATTSLVGIKRGISYQSLAETLYVEPHQGIQSGSPSRQQLRRVIKALERAGLVYIQSDDKHLILKCLLANSNYSVQNKADTNPTQQADTNPAQRRSIKSSVVEVIDTNPDIPQPLKADTPHIEDNYLYIFLQQMFEQFWSLYPEKKSRECAFETFKKINPDDQLLRTMLQAIECQIKARSAKESRGEWVPAWKYPANWLAQKCWEDEVRIEVTEEKRNAKHRPSTKNTAHDPFWNPETEDTASASEDEFKPNNVINLQCYRQQ